MAALTQLCSLYLAKRFQPVNRDAVVQWPGVSNPGGKQQAGRPHL
jgi:hypothetical protein